MVRARQWGKTGGVLAAAGILACTMALAGCGSSEPEAPLLAMPDLVGKTIGDAEVETYDALHTSLIYYDLSPADRESANDWVIVATSPEANAKTRKFKTVYAWALRASEYQWFKAHPTMPKIPTGTSAAKLVGKGGLLEPVKDLVQLRYSPGKVPKSAKPSPVDAKVFAPDRGLHPDLATEPTEEFALREGLLAALAPGNVAAGTRPAVGLSLRTGQFLVLLVITKPPAKPGGGSSGSGGSGGSDFGLPSGSSGGGGTGGGGTGGTGGGTSLPGGGQLPGGVDIPNCPKAICG